MNIKYLYFILAVMLFPWSDVFAQEKINSFDVRITVNEDATIDVTETIQYDFGSEKKHGIMRHVPVRYNRNGNLYTLRMDNVVVKNMTGNPYQVESSQEGNNIRLKIGDPDKKVTGQQVYIVSYRIKRAINYFDQHDELYWNATGEESEILVEKSSVVVTLPSKVQPGEVKKKPVTLGQEIINKLAW